MILAAQSEAFKQENVLAERLHGRKYKDESRWHQDTWYIRERIRRTISLEQEWNSGDDQLRLRWMIYLVVLADAAESVRDAIGFEYCLASSSGWTKGTYDSDFGGYNEGMSPVLWAESRESSLIGPELVLETTDKVVLIKEKLKAARDRQKSYVDFRRKPLESEVGDRVLLKVSPWKGVVRLGKKGKLAPRYVGPFEILERTGLVAYRLRLPEELIGAHDTFHVSNLKKCLGNANLHVPLNEIKIDKTLRFVEEPVEIMDREIKSLKRSRIPLVKVHWNSKRGPEFTWEREDYMKSKYPQLFVDHAVEPTIACRDLEAAFEHLGNHVEDVMLGRVAIPHHGIDLWLQVQIFYDHVNPVTRRTIDQSAGGKLRDRNAKESWALLEDLALYDNESWNDPRDFAKPVKAISLPQDVLSTSDRRLIELENQVQRLMEAHLALTQPTQVNKNSLPQVRSAVGPYDTQYCMERTRTSLLLNIASTRTDKTEGKDGYTFKSRAKQLVDYLQSVLDKLPKP
ncbi:hypothetical protein Tco_0413433 [Tanacetum coccineum]